MGIICILQAIKDWRWEQPGDEASVLLCYDIECIGLCGNGEIEAVWSAPLKQRYTGDMSQQSTKGGLPVWCQVCIVL